MNDAADAADMDSHWRASPAERERENGGRVLCAVRGTHCVSGIVRAVHQSFTKLGDTPLARLDLLESLPSRIPAVWL